MWRYGIGSSTQQEFVECAECVEKLFKHYMFRLWRIKIRFYKSKRHRRRRTRVRNIYLFWRRHFNNTSDFLFRKLFSLSSNISNFSFKQRENIFDWELYAINWFFTANITFGLDILAFKFQYSTDSFVSFSYLLILNDLLWFAYRFWMCFH